MKNSLKSRQLYNNADARNETFERYNGTFKQQCCAINIPSPIKFTNNLPNLIYIKLNFYQPT